MKRLDCFVKEKRTLYVAFDFKNESSIGIIFDRKGLKWFEIEVKRYFYDWFRKSIAVQIPHFTIYYDHLYKGIKNGICR